MQTAEEYIWSDTLNQTLEHWLAENKVHEIEGNGDHPWLCVTRNWWPAVAEDDEEKIAQRDKALRSGRNVLKHLGNRLKEVKEPAAQRKLEQGYFQKLARENMSSIAFKYHHSVGYWSLTRKADKDRSGAVTGKKLDHLFEQLAFSLVEKGGALEATPAKMVAISLAPKDGGKKAHQHEIRIYMKNIFMESHAKKVLQALILHHGVVHAWAKSDMYEELHILNIKKDRIIPETVWMPEDLLKKDETKEMTEACTERKKEEKESGGGASDRSTWSVKRKQKEVSARGSKPWDQSDSDGEGEEDELESEAEDQHVSTHEPPPRKKAKKGDGQVQFPLPAVRSSEIVEIEDCDDDKAPGAGGGADDDADDGVRIEELLDEVMGDGLVAGEVDEDDEGEEEVEWEDSD